MESKLERARTELASAAIDSVVFNPDPLDDADCLEFVTDLRTIAPDCPLILFTSFPPSEVADDLLAQSTTLIERSDEPGNWGFLIEKIQSNLQATPNGNHDEEMYRMLVETARDGLYRLDRNGNIIYANESWADMLGYERSEVLGIHASQAMADGELKSGQRIIQQVFDDDDRESDIIDLEMVSNDGDEFTVAVHFVVLTTEDGAYDGVMGVVREVTEQRATERELERKNERLNQFVSTVSDDLRNPLNVAQG